MSLNAALSLFLDEYPRALSTPFARSSLAEFIRTDIPKAIQAIIGANERYITHGSAGQGNWARVPWAAVFDCLITDSAQHGYYIVYLVREDFAGVYLSLNQGVTVVRQKYGADAKQALKARASDFIAQVGTIKTGWTPGPIDLAASSASSLGSYYEQGAIYSKYYSRSNLPSDDILDQDLLYILDTYFLLATKEVIPTISGQQEDDEEAIEYENLLLLREHKRIERNSKLAKKAKQIHGYDCQVCQTNFEQTYGELGKNYIEAHHLTPLSVLKGKKVPLNPKTDFAVLCANCHRMIHKTELVSDIKTFKKQHLINK